MAARSPSTAPYTVASSVMSVWPEDRQIAQAPDHRQAVASDERVDHGDERGDGNSQPQGAAELRPDAARRRRPPARRGRSRRARWARRRRGRPARGPGRTRTPGRRRPRAAGYRAGGSSLPASRGTGGGWRRRPPARSGCPRRPGSARPRRPRRPPASVPVTSQVGVGSERRWRRSDRPRVPACGRPDPLGRGAAAGCRQRRSGHRPAGPRAALDQVARRARRAACSRWPRAMPSESMPDPVPNCWVAAGMPTLPSASPTWRQAACTPGAHSIVVG